MIDLALIEALLRAKAREFLELSAHLAALETADPRVAEARRTASEALAKGDFETADESLDNAERLDRGRRIDPSDYAPFEAMITSLAETRALRAAAARLRLDYLTAAEHFGVAALILQNLGPTAGISYLVEEASTLVDHGRVRGDNEALYLAIERLEETFRILSFYSRDPLVHAEMMSRLLDERTVLSGKRGNWLCVAEYKLVRIRALLASINPVGSTKSYAHASG